MISEPGSDHQGISLRRLAWQLVQVSRSGSVLGPPPPFWHEGQRMEQRAEPGDTVLQCLWVWLWDRRLVAPPAQSGNEEGVCGCVCVDSKEFSWPPVGGRSLSGTSAMGYLRKRQ